MPEAQTPTQALFEVNEVYFADLNGDHGTKYAFQVVAIHNGSLTLRDSHGLRTVAVFNRPQSQAAVIQNRCAWADLPASEVFGPQWVAVFIETLDDMEAYRQTLV
jgi:hypothetical protein